MNILFTRSSFAALPPFLRSLSFSLSRLFSHRSRLSNMKLSNIPIVAAALIRLASARFEIDAVFYGGFYNCDVFGVTCTDLPENTCCAASQNGAREYHDGLFFHDASKAEGSINGFRPTMIISPDLNSLTRARRHLLFSSRRQRLRRCALAD